MGTLFLDLGKGYRERNSPYRSIIIFGHEPWSGEGWDLSFPLDIVEPTRVFDLSALAEYHEVAAGLFTLSNTSTGQYTLTQRWYRERDNKLLYTHEDMVSLTGTGSISGASWIGYLPWEIWENGRYRYEVEVAGPESYSSFIQFSVIGIKVEPPPPERVAEGLAGIIEAFAKASAWCYIIYIAMLDWIWPFNLLANPFYSLSTIFMGASSATGGFNTWVLALADQVKQTFSWDYIKGLILSWLPGIADAVSWWYSWYQQVLAVFDSLWPSIVQVVTGWIAFATEGLSTLRANWDTFIAEVLPNLLSLDWLFTWWDSRILDVQNLINTAFILRDSLWSGWDTWRDSVAEFFANPVQYIWSRFIDWFLGPEG